MAVTKQEQLNQLKQELEQDQSLPLRKGATQLVFGEGNPDAQIYFLGEAPGYWEDLKGRPFIGQAGKLLDQLLESIGLDRKDVYISNVVRFRPPDNRDPTDEEIAAFAPFVDQEIEIIDPKLIVTLGRFSMAKFIPGQKISQIHGQKRTVNFKRKMLMVVPMYHPAAALRNGQVLGQIKEDFKKLLGIASDDNSQENNDNQNLTKEQLRLL